MNNSLRRMRVIDEKRLDGEKYFESLLREAGRSGLLGSEDLERLQYECLALLAERTERYNAGDSSSIRVEKAQSILKSNLFTVGVCLKEYPAPEDAVDALQSEPAAALYQKGRERIGTMLLTAKSFHQKLLGRLINTGNIFYRETVRDAIYGFFKLYYPDFAAQEIHITADYPTYIPLPRLAGIEFIRAYLNALYYENEFCRSFPADRMRRLLRSYEAGYEELLLNLYEPVLAAAAGCVLTGADTARLTLTERDAAYLRQRFESMRAGEIGPLLHRAAEALVRRFAWDAGLARYVQDSMPVLAAAIRSAAKRQMLDRVFFPM